MILDFRGLVPEGSSRHRPGCVYMQYAEKVDEGPFMRSLEGLVEV